MTVGNQTIYFRGRRILETIFDELATTANLGAATEFILSGCSAGGLSTFLHADRVQSWLPAGVKFGAVPESGSSPCFLRSVNGVLSSLVGQNRLLPQPHGREQRQQLRLRPANARRL